MTITKAERELFLTTNEILRYIKLNLIFFLQNFFLTLNETYIPCRRQFWTLFDIKIKKTKTLFCHNRDFYFSNSSKIIQIFLT